jgi:hypothetical protein
MIFLSDKGVVNLPKGKLKQILWRQRCKNLDVYCSKNDTSSQAYAHSGNKRSVIISLMWADRYIKIHYNPNFETASVGNLEDIVNNEYRISVGELIRESALPKLCGTCRIIDNNIWQLLRAITHSIDITDRDRSETSMLLSRACS